MSISGFDLFAYIPQSDRDLIDVSVRCAVKGCAFPSREGELCFHHLHFFDFRYSLMGTDLAIEDMYDNEDPYRPVLYVAQAGELEDLEKHLKVTFTRNLQYEKPSFLEPIVYQTDPPGYTPQPKKRTRVITQRQARKLNGQREIPMAIVQPDGSLKPAEQTLLNM